MCGIHKTTSEPNRNTIEFLGLWEKLNNPGFKLVEFDQFRNADISQLVCLSNLENLNALFISESLQQEERLLKLNRIAIQQMKLLTDDRRVKKLGVKSTGTVRDYLKALMQKGLVRRMNNKSRAEVLDLCNGRVITHR